MSTFQSVDANGDGRISWEEYFLAFLEDEFEAEDLDEAQNAINQMGEEEWKEFYEATKASLSLYNKPQTISNALQLPPENKEPTAAASSPLGRILWQDMLHTVSEDKIMLVVQGLLDEGAPLHTQEQVRTPISPLLTLTASTISMKMR